MGWLAWAFYFPRRIRQLPQGVMFPTPILVASGVGHVLNLGAQVLNSAGLFPGTAASIYYFGIVWVLMFSAAIFANVVFRRPER